MFCLIKKGKRSGNGNFRYNENPGQELGETQKGPIAASQRKASN
jgi:hypothetical protein